MKKLLSSILLALATTLCLVACGTSSITKDLDVKFVGYDGGGNLEYNKRVIEAKIQEELLKKSKTYNDLYLSENSDSN